jgi:hypothetical protein
MLKHIFEEKGVKVLILVNGLTIILCTKCKEHSGSVKTGNQISSYKPSNQDLVTWS